MWVKLDDRFYMHPKVLATSLEGIGLFALGLSYAGAYETDGRISHSLVSLIARDRLELVSELVRNGLWIARETGYEIHDFLTYNPSKAALIRERKAAKRRMKLVRARSGEHRPNERRTPGRVGLTTSVLSSVPEGGTGKVRKGRGGAAQPMPADFTLTEARRAYAVSGGLDPEYEFAKFDDHYRGNGGRFVDWDATWRNWCRRAWEFAQRGAPRRS